MQTIVQRTQIPISCNVGSNTQVTITSINGARFHAAVVPETIANNDARLVQELLNSDSPSTRFSTVVSHNDISCGDRFVAVVEPENGMVTVSVSTVPSSRAEGFSLNQRQVYAVADWAIVVWWKAQSPTMKALYGVGIVILILLIIWAIWYMIAGKNKRKPVNMAVNYPMDNLNF